MPVSGTWAVREALPGVDDGAVADLMVEYLEWANGRLRDEYGIDDPPTDPGRVLESLAEFRRPRGLLLLAESDGSVFSAPHYDGHGSVLILLDEVDETLLANLLLDSYLIKAPPAIRRLFPDAP